MNRPKSYAALIVTLLLTVILCPLPLLAADFIEGAGVGVGVTAGNILFVPAKIATLSDISSPAQSNARAYLIRPASR